MGRGRSVYKQPGTRVDTWIAPHRKEGFQVSKRDPGTRGVIKGLRHKLNIVNLYIYIVLLCECG
jgi:hypothetical protein